jgi:hypothetical protein
MDFHAWPRQCKSDASMVTDVAALLRQFSDGDTRCAWWRADECRTHTPSHVMSVKLTSTTGMDRLPSRIVAFPSISLTHPYSGNGSSGPPGGRRDIWQQLLAPSGTTLARDAANHHNHHLSPLGRCGLGDAHAAAMITLAWLGALLGQRERVCMSDVNKPEPHHSAARELHIRTLHFQFVLVRMTTMHTMILQGWLRERAGPGAALVPGASACGNEGAGPCEAEG